MKKIGLALAGGGARGAYQIGAWKALIELGIDKKISVYSGASVGSLNAVLIAKGDYDLAYKTWMALNKYSLFNMEKQLLKKIFKERMNLINEGVYNTKKLEELMDETIDYDDVKNKDIFIATTCLGKKRGTFYELLRTNYLHFFKSENQIKYKLLKDLDANEIRQTMLASCAIPIVFKPVTINHETFFDGGILDNVPYKPLIDAGCDLIIAIDLFKKSFHRKKEIKGAKIITVRPKRSLRGILDFRNKYIVRRLELGYLDTLEIISNHLNEIND